MSITDILSLLALTGAFGFAFDLIGLVVTVRVLKNRIYDIITTYIEEFIEDISAHPEKLQPITDAFVRQGMKSVGIAPSKMKQATLNVPLLGKVPLEPFMPIIQPLIEKQVAKYAGEGAEAATQGFG